MKFYLSFRYVNRSRQNTLSFNQVWISKMISFGPQFVLMVWSFHVMITWKQRQHDLTHRWGTMKYQENETPRPQFNGKYKICEVTKRSIVTYPAWKRWMKYMISIPLTMMFTTYAFLGVIMVYTNRDNVLAKYFGDPNQNVGELFNLTWNLSIIGKTDAIVAVELSTDHLSNPKFWWTVGLFPSLIGLGLPLLNFVLMRLSRMLNNFENHRTESHYRNALIAKVIAFRFVAYFAALYYYASIAAIGGFGGMAVKNGFLRIATSLVIYLTIQHWWNLLLQICVPLLILRYHKDRRNNRLRKEQRELEHSKKEYRTNKDLTVEELKRLGERITNKEALLTQGTSELWDELILPDYDPFFDYIQSVIYFAYVVCFSTVFPLTPLLVLINQLINMRLHAYKICRVRRRPLAQKTGGVSLVSIIFKTIILQFQH
jgi:anoctamin-10